MDRVRTELMPPLLVAEMQREARRMALAEAARPSAPLGATLASHVGGALVRVGHRLEAVGRRRASAPPLTGRLAHR